jgi:acylphosphatase
MQQEAERVGASGWVKNLADGTVEAVVEGESALVDRMVAWSRVGPPAARVVDVRVVSEAPGRLRRFEIRYGPSE